MDEEEEKDQEEMVGCRGWVNIGTVEKDEEEEDDDDVVGRRD